MKYSKEQKLMWVKAHREGKLTFDMTPEGVARHVFMDQVRSWASLAEIHGDDAVGSGGKHKAYSADFKLSAVMRVEAGESVREVARSLGMPGHHPLSEWARAYRLSGPDGLKSKPKGRKNKSMPKKKKQTRDEELEYLRAENAFLKKYTELLAKHGMAPASSGSKQRPSKSSERKGTD